MSAVTQGSEPLHKACDTCRARKTRCKISGSTDACDFCLSQHRPCSFTPVKRPRKRKYDTSVFIPLSPTYQQSVRDLPGPQLGSESVGYQQPGLYIDSLLANRQASRIHGGASHPDQLTTIFGPNPNISFFPERRVRAISQRLGHNRLDQLLDEIRAVVATKVKNTCAIPQSYIQRHLGTGKIEEVPSRDIIDGHISAYFDAVHPIYPFLCPNTFRERAASQELVQSLGTDKVWAALFYAILAIGCQNNEGGSYDTGVGEAWSYFERSLSCFQDLLFGRGSLTAVQALLAMEEPCRRTFWVLYYMEKTSCFATGKTSGSMVQVVDDANISCAIPDMTESTFHDYDWFFNFVKYARLVSKIHQSLFTISSVSQPLSTYDSVVESLRIELEAWRANIPPRFRPGEKFKTRSLQEPLAVQVALITHFLYLNALLTLSWTVLHYGAVRLGSTQQEIMKRDLMRTARSVLELTVHIEVAPSTPVWILAVLPLSSLMILFDLVVHNANHPETGLSLALLDIAGGHFSRLEYASNGALPGSLIAEFAHLARQYVSETRKPKSISRDNNDNSIPFVSQDRAEPSPSAPEPRTSTLTADPTELAVPAVLPQEPEPVATNAPGVMQPWSPASLDRSETLFLPYIDDPTYYFGDLQLLGIDLKDLFDNSYQLPAGSDHGV
ncbi:transcriptional regulator family: Fungal Specific TF [Aspergillus niger]|nr:transcriptional regulator family: Fungal Specific TF [Aspergillus niger]KAI2939573.1 transcriptional regulator family: Fungal Specific TF [Aspergillus niger]KAI2959103.1 transcriptional regulator family: Fungal Specific TF [Aspergillus niger]KAI2979238.1 transcriptional regulator family: Fungal Specific TF [Aspergillus niger]